MEPQTKIEEAAKAIAANLPKNEGYGLDWTILVDIVMALLGDCLSNRSPQQVAKAMERIGVAERFALRRVCRSAANELGQNFNDLVRACEKACEDANDEQRLECCQAVQAQMGAAR